MEGIKGNKQPYLHLWLLAISYWLLAIGKKSAPTVKGLSLEPSVLRQRELALRSRL
jgi:hypothetical protein